MKVSFDKIKSYFSKVKHKEIIVAIILAIILLVIYFGSTTLTTTGNNQPEKNDDYCARMCNDVLEAVKLMTDSDDCKVIISWEAGVESVIAYTTSSSGNGTTQSPEIITSNGQSSPIVLREEFPTAKSVAVVCPKNTSITTKMNIKYMIATLLNVDVNSVAIYNC